MSRQEYDLTAPAEPKWVELRTPWGLAFRRSAYLFAGGVWEFFTLLIAATLLHNNPGPHSIVAVLLFILCLLAGLAPLGLGLRMYLAGRSLDEAKVFVDRAPPAIGQSFQVRVEQLLRRTLRLNEIRVGLVCLKAAPRDATRRGGGGGGLVPIFQKWETFKSARDYEAGKLMSATRSFKIPADQSPSSPPDQKPVPIRWKIRVVTSLTPGPAYEADFALQVFPPPPPSDAMDS